MHKKETIIVGAGIAGLSLAWELFQRNKSFVIYNYQNNLPSASLTKSSPLETNASFFPSGERQAPVSDALVASDSSSNSAFCHDLPTSLET